MNFQSLKKNNFPTDKPSNSQKGIKKSQKPSSDTLKNDKASDDNTRIRLLQSIKKKVKRGYYESDEVIDDLSDAFAKVFDKTL